MKNRLKLLWLPGWFPSIQDPLAGDFVERHAKAVSQFADVTILFVAKDFSLAKGKHYINIEKNSGLHIYRAYYNNAEKLGWIGKMQSAYLYYKLLFKIYKQAKSENAFDLLHVHVAHRQALLALWVKWKKGIPYLTTEHNSWFMPVGNQFYTHSILLQQIIKLNFKQAAAVQVVSAGLGNALKEKFSFIPSYTVIPNVVDTEIFTLKSPSFNSTKLQFFTITGDVYHKNTDGTIRAFAAFIKKGYTAILHIAGRDNEVLKTLVQKLDVVEQVKFHGEISNKAVAAIMQETDAFIFFSRYETFGCAMTEALCCGTPVIASRLPVLEENLTEFTNALLVNSEDENELTEKLIYFSENKNIFNKEAIELHAKEKYNYQKVGNVFLDLYHAVLKHPG